MNDELRYFDFGEIPLKEADDANIPVNCFLSPPENDKYWRWTALNYMPRKERIGEAGYEIRAESKEEILKVLNKYVVPLYQVALTNLKKDGELYYWQLNED